MRVHFDKPADIPFPWADGSPRESVTPEELAAARQSLRERSAFAD
jgi:hypothetical protein